ncbi:MAG: redoxin domain-containing protein [Leptolyngbyaceae cyanobacterium SM1_1_3]|nr:redoxin domain-containing protein [Leptolyngbyaceae cyanobacterium SM1_1_3]NJN01899.1 redoxin domain-containing protein [Leptolyngbyaceae cyanobacterium RM1_1_2]
MLTSTNFSGLINQRFFKNFLPIPARSSLDIGDRAPDFHLLHIQSQQMLTLSDYWGQQPVVLALTRIFTENQYCPLCFPHIVALNKSYRRLQAKGAAVLMITSTDERQSKTVQQDLNLEIPLLSNPDCQIFRRYGTGQALGAPLPAQFILDRRGNIIYRHLFSFVDSNANVERLLKYL